MNKPNVPIWMQENIFPLYYNRKSDKILPPRGWSAKPSGDYDWSQRNICGYGIRGKDNLVIIDIDNKPDQSAAEQLTLLAQAGFDADTYMQKSKSDGLHLVYKNDLNFMVKTYARSMAAASLGAKYVDIRGEGGYIVGAQDEPYPNGTYSILQAGSEKQGPLPYGSSGNMDILPVLDR